jgi:hypothetical protein
MLLHQPVEATVLDPEPCVFVFYQVLLRQNCRRPMPTRNRSARRGQIAQAWRRGTKLSAGHRLY